MKSVFPYHKLFFNLLEKDFSNEFLSAIWNFAFYLYVDNEPLNNVEVPQFFRVVQNSRLLKMKKYLKEGIEIANKDSSNQDDNLPRSQKKFDDEEESEFDM